MTTPNRTAGTVTARATARARVWCATVVAAAASLTVPPTPGPTATPGASTCVSCASAGQGAAPSWVLAGGRRPG